MYNPPSTRFLEEPVLNGDVESIAAVLAYRAGDRPVGLDSEDKRVRTTADAFGATVTGPIGVVVRGVEAGLAKDDGLDIFARRDSRGLHMTGELRDNVQSRIQAAAEEI